MYRSIAFTGLTGKGYGREGWRERKGEDIIEIRNREHRRETDTGRKKISRVHTLYSTKTILLYRHYRHHYVKW